MSIQISKNKKVALLFGANGLVGRHCLDLLLLSDNYSKVISFSRRKINSEHPKLVQKIIDFDQLLDYKDQIKGDDLFCCIGTTIKKAGSKEAFQKVDYTYIYEIARLASLKKVSQFLLVSAIGADPDALFFYNRVKGKTELAVKDLPFWGIHIFQPSLLLGERIESRLAEKIAGVVGEKIGDLFGNIFSKYQPVKATIVAKAMVIAAQGLSKGVHIYPSDQLEHLADKKGSIKPYE